MSKKKDDVINVTVPVDIPKERIISLFITACEGGSNYWCKELTPKGSEDMDAYEAMLEGFVLIDGYENKKHNVTPKKIREALILMATKYPEHFADMLSENDDADTADVFLQLCTFKELVYG